MTEEGQRKQHLCPVCNVLKVNYKIKIFSTESLLIRKILFFALSLTCCCRKMCLTPSSVSLGIKSILLLCFALGAPHARVVALVPLSLVAFLSVPFTSLVSVRGEDWSVS